MSAEAAHVIHHTYPHRGNALSRFIGASLLRLAGWRFEGELPPIDKCVLIVAPHTSNWDFPVGVAAMFALRLDVRWLGKHTLFRKPFDPLMRWLGGIPVNRRATGGVVERVVEEFRASPTLFLAIAPEGTRRRVNEWKTGFHRIARAAGVPIQPVAFDYSKRAIVFSEPLTPTPDADADIALLRSRYKSTMAKHPELYAE